MLSGNRYPLSRLHRVILGVSEVSPLFLNFITAVIKNSINYIQSRDVQLPIIRIIFFHSTIRYLKKMEIAHVRFPSCEPCSHTAFIKCKKLLEFFETHVFRVNFLPVHRRRYRSVGTNDRVAHKLAVIVAAIETRYAVPMSLRAKGRALGCESDKKDTWERTT